MSKLKDITGMRFGKLIALSVVEQRGKHNKVLWKCRCDCGHEVNIPYGNLAYGNSKSCGCVHTEQEDISGRRYGSLTAIRCVGKRESDLLWEFLCDCGNTVIIKKRQVTHKGIKPTRSCGCSRKTHGHKHNNTYHTWQGMKARCYNKNSFGWDRYGGRGITVCERWKDSFEDFLEDMGECPKGMSIDRINNDGDYEPENCRWATRSQQQRNKRNNRKIVAFGEEKTMTEWEEITGISDSTIDARIKNGLLPEEALSKPVQRRKDIMTNV